MKKTVLIPEDIAETGKNYLLERGYALKVGCGTDIETLKRALSDADAVIVRNAGYPEAVFADAERLKVIARHGTGTDNIDVEAAERRGIWVVNGPLANIHAVAEYTIALILAAGCRLLEADQETRSGNWQWRLSMERHEIGGKTLGLIGFGHIGQLVASAASALGMRVMAYDLRQQSTEIPGAVLCRNLEEVLSAADYLSLHIPSTPETRGLFGYETFRKMKKGSVFINAARGDLYDPDALIRVLEEGHLSAAALDVYPEEPLKNSRLTEMRQVLLSQHNAGLSEESKDNMSLYAAMGVHQVLSGQTPQWPVNHPAVKC